ncbi:hypothetical protein [Spirosoma flavus]
MYSVKGHPKAINRLRVWTNKVYITYQSKLNKSLKQARPGTKYNVFSGDVI